MRTTRRKLKRKVPFIICCVLLLALLAGGCMWAKNIFFPSPDGGDTPPVTPDQRLNVLLLGIDARRGETMARTDTVILASVDPKSKQMTLLSIPRDTRVNIPGHGWDKVNSAAVYGGPELSMKVASDLLGIPVKYYVLTNFSGFKDIVDALGGVTLDVERNMYHEDETDGRSYEINLKKGVQRLNGEKALQYVRYRDYEMGDIDRTKYQQKFLVALAKEMLQPGTILKLPKLVPEINRYVKTNLSVNDMLTMASASKSLENGNIVTQTLPGRPMNINGGSYWGVDPTEARQMVARLFNGETVTNIVLTTPLSGQYIGPVGLKPSTQPKDDEIPPAAAQQAQQPPKTQQGQSGTKPAAKPGQGTQNGAGGSGGTVTITPVSTGTGTNTGTTPGKPSTGTQPGTSTGTSGKTGTSTGGTSGTGGINPSIPGSTKTSTSTS